MNLTKVEINNEKVFLKKDFLGFRVVEPIRDPDTKEFIWKNFLSKKGFALLFFILFLLTIIYLAVGEQIQNYKRVVENPCDYCIDCRSKTNLDMEAINLWNTTLT